MVRRWKMGDVVNFFPGEPPSGFGGGGPNDPTLSQRVEQLEREVARGLAILESLQSVVRDIATEQRELGKQLRELAMKLSAVEGRIGASDGRLAGIEGRIGSIDSRLNALPTTWHILGILATMLIGITGIIFAVGNFIKP